MAKHNTSDPILVLVRKGRNGRGFTVSPVEDISNSAMCIDEKELGEAILEMLDDENQPRVNVADLLNASSNGDSKANDGDIEDEQDSDENHDDTPSDGDGSIMDGVANADDPADRLLFNLFTSAIKKGQSMSSKRVKSSGRRRRR